MIRIVILLIVVFCSLCTKSYTQNHHEGNSLPQKDANPVLLIKSNLLYDLTTTINVGGEVRLSDRLSLDVSFNYNPWTFSDNRKLKHVLVQPELRYWMHQPFNGHSLGGNVLYSHFNAGNLPFGSLKDYRYNGDAYGVGFSYNYQWRLSPRWGLEVSIGLGYIYLNYKRYECQTCGNALGKDSKNYFGPTKAGISLIYIIK